MSGVDLVQWLGEQLDEDERIAREASRLKSGRLDEKWVVEHHVVWPSTWGENESPITASGVPDPETGVAHGAAAARAAHVAEWDPARVLREIEVDRELLREYERLLREYERLLRAHAQHATAMAELAADIENEERTGRWEGAGDPGTRQLALRREADYLPAMLHVMERWAKAKAAVYADRPGYLEEWRL